MKTISDAGEPAAGPEPVAEPDAAETGALPELTFILDLDPADADRLRTVPELARSRGDRVRTGQFALVWHDTADGYLARRGLALEEWRRGASSPWRVARMRAAGPGGWVPGTPPDVLADSETAAAALAGISDDDGPFLPVVAFEGTRRSMRLEAGKGRLSMTVEQGVLRAVTAERAVCRIVLRGPPAAVLDTALAVSSSLRARLSPTTFAAEAIGLARPASPPHRAEAPALSPDMTIGDAFAHVVAHQTATMLRLAPSLIERHGPEPVHQMRVATRRLRAAIKVFAHAGGCPELDEAKLALRELARVLGPARDWDVFTEQTAAGLETCHEEAAVRRLLAAARRRRAAGYAALAGYIGSPAFRRLGVRLAGLAATRPRIAPGGMEDMKLADFAAHRLSRMQRKLLAVEEDVTTLPAADLHALRLRAKKLRYAAELFAPLFPGKATGRCIRRVSALQEALGVLNDGAVTAKLVAEIERRPGFAAGVVAGHVAARASGARADIGAAWRKLARTQPAWS